jgi:hypothetical protein
LKPWSAQVFGLQVAQLVPEQAPASPEPFVPQRLGPSPPQNWPSGQVPHSTTPVHRVSVTKPQFALSCAHVEGQPSELAPPIPRTKPPEVAAEPLLPAVPLSPPELAAGESSGGRGELPVAVWLPQPEATAKEPIITSKTEPSQVLISSCSSGDHGNGAHCRVITWCFERSSEYGVRNRPI